MSTHSLCERCGCSVPAFIRICNDCMPNPDLDAYALRVAEAVREACYAECHKENASDRAQYMERRDTLSARIGKAIRAIDLSAIIKGVKR